MLVVSTNHGRNILTVFAPNIIDDAEQRRISRSRSAQHHIFPTPVLRSPPPPRGVQPADRERNVSDDRLHHQRPFTPAGNHETLILAPAMRSQPVGTFRESTFPSIRSSRLFHGACLFRHAVAIPPSWWGRGQTPNLSDGNRGAPSVPAHHYRLPTPPRCFSTYFPPTCFWLPRSCSPSWLSEETSARRVDDPKMAVTWEIALQRNCCKSARDRGKGAQGSLHYRRAGSSKAAGASGYATAHVTSNETLLNLIGGRPCRTRLRLIWCSRHPSENSDQRERGDTPVKRQPPTSLTHALGSVTRENLFFSMSNVCA